MKQRLNERLNDRMHTVYERARRPEISIGAALLAVGLVAAWLAYRRNPEAAARIGRQVGQLGRSALNEARTLKDERIAPLAGPLRRMTSRHPRDRASTT